MVKRRPFLWIFVFSVSSVVNLFAQEPVQNFGNLKVHQNGAMGFHDNLINNGAFDENSGLAGFFNEDILTISGAFRPIFNDMEVMVANDLILEVGVGVTNNINFVLGDVRTPRSATGITIDFISDAFYASDANLSKIDGYAAITYKKSFVFPIGDADKLRPLEIFTDAKKNLAKSAYFFEDPNHVTRFSSSFNTESNADILTKISTYEFWDLDTDTASTIKLAWDADSNLSSFVDKIENLRIAGWHTTNRIWEDLGGNAIAGDFNAGQITSNTFVPGHYSAITFGSGLSPDNIDLGNYLLTPNGDGINDFLHFDAVSLSPENNALKVFNRWGRLVYQAEGYQNDFNGRADNGIIVAVDEKLPDGVYFYILDLQDINVVHQGYFAIRN